MKGKKMGSVHQNNAITAPRALVRDRYWGYQQKQIKAGRSPNLDEVKAITTLLQIDLANSTNKIEEMAKILICQSFIRSVTGIPNNATVIGDSRVEEWLSLYDKNTHSITYDLNESREQALLSVMHNHIFQGEQEFEFGPALVEEFRHTEVDDILCEEISFPYGVFYIRFQGLEGKTFEGKPLDGFLLWKTKSEGLHIYPLSSSALPAWGELDEEGRCSYSHMTILNHQDPKKPFVEMSRGIINELDEMIDMIRKTPLESVDQEWIEAVIANHENARNLIEQQHTEWMRHIVNALLTIDSGGIEPENAYPSGAPEDLTEKALSDRPGARKADQRLRAARKADQRLRAEGFVRLKRYEVPQQGESASASGKSISPHWRRGHWRKQHYGPAKSLVKRIRIAPTIINAGKGDLAPRKGYKV